MQKNGRTKIDAFCINLCTLHKERHLERGTNEFPKWKTKKHEILQNNPLPHLSDGVEEDEDEVHKVAQPKDRLK